MTVKKNHSAPHTCHFLPVTPDLVQVQVSLRESLRTRPWLSWLRPCVARANAVTAQYPVVTSLSTRDPVIPTPNASRRELHNSISCSMVSLFFASCLNVSRASITGLALPLSVLDPSNSLLPACDTRLGQMIIVVEHVIAETPMGSLLCMLRVGARVFLQRMHFSVGQP